MIWIEFNDEDKAALNYERYNHPHPFVQQKMEVLWLKSQGLPHKEICRLACICSTTLTSCGKSVGDRWIPVIHAGTKVRHKDQRQSDLLPESAISKTNSARLYESGRGRNVCVFHALNAFWIRVTDQTARPT